MSAKAEHYDVIVKPIITEKATMTSENNGVVFQVAKDSNKPQIKQAVEAIFEVKVDSVNTANRKGKTRRTRFGTGKRKDTKRAIVTLKSGTIDIFTAVG